MWQWSTGALMAVILAAAGCDKPSSPQPSSPQPAPSHAPAGEVKTYSAAELPAVGEPLPPLDQGRVEFAPPQGWQVLSRQSQFLARFSPQGKSKPEIRISAMSAPDDTNVTRENAAAFASQMQARSEAVSGRRILEPCRPVVLGDQVWSRHVRHVSMNRQPTVLQSLETARDGRLYAIDLYVPCAGETDQDIAKAIMAHRDEAYAVAANWKFLKESRPPADVPAGAESAVESAEPSATDAAAEIRSREETPQPGN